MQNNILITGSRGFIGNELRSIFNAHHDVAVFEISRGKSFFRESEVPHVDLGNFDQISSLIKNLKFEYIYHLASDSSVLNSWEKPFDHITNNVRSTFNITKSIIRYSPQTKLIYVSSSAVYARSTIPISENDVLGPDSPYGMGKLISEYEVSKIPKYLIIRPFFVIGPKKKNDLLDDWITQIHGFKKDESNILRVGNLDVERDFISIKSAASIIAFLGANEEGIFNLGTGKSTSLREIIEILKSISSYDFSIQEKNPTKLRIADRNKVIADVSKLKSKVNLSKEPNLANLILEIFSEYEKNDA